MKEINIKMDGNDVLNNGTYVIGNSSNTTITIENTGSESLSITGTYLSGTNSADFSTDLNPTSIAPLSSQEFSLNFNPSTTGSMFATLIIDNDDSDENPFIPTLHTAFNDENTKPDALPRKSVEARVMCLIPRRKHQHAKL